MHRTHIIAADGTRFVEEPIARRRRHRIIAIACAIAAAPFLIAALIGLGMAATGNVPATNSPLIERATAACIDAPDTYQGYCIGLYLRPAYTLTDESGAESHTPAGPAIVRECFEQGLDRSELGACLTQPIG